ncbi:MAG: aldo/keto reductase [Chloroflexi bacterium]|nr:aldo/keto reductase [Chloroflexota bacterium]
MADAGKVRRVPLGATGIEIPELGVGVWQWGDASFWGYGREYGAAEIRAAFDVCMARGLDFFDTAEVYGTGASERNLGAFLRDDGRPAIVASKFFPYPWRVRSPSILAAARASLQRLGLEKIDLYQIHWPYPPRSVETWMEGLAAAVGQGMIRAAGVSNYGPAQTRRAHTALARRGLPLASNQVRFSLLDRKPERSGLLEVCRELKVTVIAYSPLAQGLLTGKYTRLHPMRGLRSARLGAPSYSQLDRLVDLLREIGSGHEGRTPAQVALNWVLCKGAVPIPGAKTAQQAEENAGAVGWRLTPDEVGALDRATA